MSTAPITLRGAGGTLFSCRDEEVLLVGPAGASKTTPACLKLLYACRQYPGSQHLLARKTRRSMTDSCLITMESCIGETHPEVTRVSREQRHSYRLFGSEIVCAGLDEPAKAFGSAWGLVVVEEAIEIGKETWELFFRSARDPRFRREGQSNPFPYHQFIAVTNPGPSMHWLNKRATPVPKELQGRAKDFAMLQAIHAFNDGPQTGTMRRLLAVHQDNPTLYDSNTRTWTEKGLKYIRNLKRMSGHRRKWMLDGMWVAPEGTVYAGAFSDDNLIEPFRVPYDWPVWVFVDPGENHPCAVGWFTRSISGKAILIGEIHGRELGGVGNVARMIHEKNHHLGVNPIGYYLDPRHGFATTFQSTATIAEQFAKAGIPGFMPWPRFQGAGVFASVERVRDEFKTGNLLFFNDCDGFISDHQTWEYKKNADGTLAKGDDAFVDASNDACLSGDTIIETTEGPREIATLSGKTGSVYTPFGPKEFFGFKVSDDAELWELELSNGRKIRGTLDHRLLTMFGWDTIRGIQVGDCLYGPDRSDSNNPSFRRISLPPRGALLSAGREEAGVDRAHGTSSPAYDRRAEGNFSEEFMEGQGWRNSMAQVEGGEGVALKTQSRHSSQFAQDEALCLRDVREVIRAQGIFATPSWLLHGSVQVVGKRKVSRGPVYDICVPSIHFYTLAGIVSHNCDCTRGFICMNLGRPVVAAPTDDDAERAELMRLMDITDPTATRD